MLLLVVSFRYLDDFGMVLRNSGFVVATILLRRALGIEPWHALAYETTAVFLAVAMLLLERGLNARDGDFLVPDNKESSSCHIDEDSRVRQTTAHLLSTCTTRCPERHAQWFQNEEHHPIQALVGLFDGLNESRVLTDDFDVQLAEMFHLPCGGRKLLHASDQLDGLGLLKSQRICQTCCPWNERNHPVTRSQVQVEHKVMLLPFNLHHIAREPKWNMRILIRLGRSVKRRQKHRNDHNMQNGRHEFHLRECVRIADSHLPIHTPRTKRANLWLTMA